MYGKGILKGLSVTWNRFWETYLEDISWLLRGKKRYYTKEGVKLPLPVREYDLQEIALTDSKLKKLDAQKEEEFKLEGWSDDCPENAYDPNANAYADTPRRNDYELFADYYTKTKRERGVGKLGNSVQLRFFDINVSNNPASG